jgi:predicted Rossmann-fold nucleotide-binding protein
MRRICVYAGARYGRRDEYQQAAQDLAKELVRRGFGWCTEERVRV